MQEKSEALFEKLNSNGKDKHSIRQIVTTLSLVVILIVFWSLKLTGIGIAGEAFCQNDEHVHTESCASPCDRDEHIHKESCYSDITTDIETADDWEASLADIVRGSTTKDNVTLVAESQLGNGESTLNFQVDANGVRRGITRYGQWYGIPYGDWSAMFVSFCLEYGGADNLPKNAGPESMRLEWEDAELYVSAERGSPEVGNVVFLSKNSAGNSTADSVAIITAVDSSSITVIEGDLDNTVATASYGLESSLIMGYGIITEADTVTVLSEPSALAVNYTVWLDGTDGNMAFLSGSPNTAYTVQGGSILKLPSEWTSPSKYSYTLRGWYDITNSRYYEAGAEMEVTGNAVLYADWVATTYDVGQFNAKVADTVSTNEFITTHMFDYNYLFNILSSRADITVNSSQHSETWYSVRTGNVGFMNRETLDFIFVNAAPSYQERYLSYPHDRDDHNNYPGEGIVTSGIYTEERAEILFDPSDSLGKTYLGTGDHLFQIMTDPDDEYYGYYYYDSERNAASYNQTLERFYVYEYLESPSDAIGSTYSGYLPLNSPYANTNGNATPTFSYDGINGEYEGVDHYQYASGYASDCETLADFAYGMRTDIRFYLPDDSGSGGNKDIHGNDMHFHFSGDDDVWVLIDGELVLDIGGIHGVESGDINFTNGNISVQDNITGTLDIPAGEHVMSVLYLERGASQSNCAIYFNLAPRYGLNIQKEDVLTQEVLDGTQFSVFTDEACTTPAELYSSEDAYRQGEASTNVFTVENGSSYMWGLSPSKTYYIKETGAPDKEGYGLPFGTIQLKIEREGQSTYHVDVIADVDGNEPSSGFTVHGTQIDEETQSVYIVVTNAPETVTETTTVQVIKKWEDSADHSGDYILAYLTVTDPDGTVRRIREITLSDENSWTYIWTNLPKYDYDNLTEVQYGIEESYESGYYSTVRKVTQIEIENTVWAESLSFKNGETYILRTANGYLSTLNDGADTGYKWVDEQTAKSSPNALWTATVNGSTVKFTNGVGQTITFYYNGGSPTDFYASTGSGSQQARQEFYYRSASGGLQIYYRHNNRGSSYYIAKTMNSVGKFNYTTSSGSALLFTPVCKVTETDIRDVEDWAYQITNTPLAAGNETSVSVQKEWSLPDGYDQSMYQEFAVTVRLYANGNNTGRSITLSLKNNWKGSFLGLPYKDENGNVISYTVTEVWEQPKWSTAYGEINASSSTPPTYSTVIVNTYTPGGPILPSTGSAARPIFVLCGSMIILGTLIYGIGSRRKRERRMK